MNYILGSDWVNENILAFARGDYNNFINHLEELYCNYPHQEKTNQSTDAHISTFKNDNVTFIFEAAHSFQKQLLEISERYPQESISTIIKATYPFHLNCDYLFDKEMHEKNVIFSEILLNFQTTMIKPKWLAKFPIENYYFAKDWYLYDINSKRLTLESDIEAHENAKQAFKQLMAVTYNERTIHAMGEENYQPTNRAEEEVKEVLKGYHKQISNVLKS